MSSEMASQPNPMLPALRRWSGWPGIARPERRWHLATRHRSRRLEERRSQPGRVFRRHGRIVHLTSRHLTLRPLTFAPQVHLLIGLTRPAASLLSSSRPWQGEESGRIRPRLVTAIRPAVSVEHLILRPVVSSGPRRWPLMASDPVGGKRNKEGADQLAVHQIAASVTERVLRSHQRMETRQQTTTVMRERQNVAVEVERALTDVNKRATDPAEPTGISGSWPVTQAFIPPTGPELDRLTDQIVHRIDDRLTAQRERMGRF